MTIEEKAYIAVPEWRIDTPKGNVDINEDYRDKWIQGYEQGFRDRGAESEDERIRKWIIELLHKLHYNQTAQPMALKAIEWLEKQKEQKLVEIHIDNPNIQKLDPNVVVETRTDGTGELDGKALLYTADKSYKIGFRDVVASVKPVEYLPEQKVFDIMTKLTNLSYSQLIPINSDEYKKLHEITSDVRELLDYPIEPKFVEWSDTNELVFKDICKHLKEEGYNGWIVLLEALRNGEFNQPSVEWSEEDEEIFNNIIEKAKGGHWIEVNEITWLINRFKSLRPQPQWKPSEEQMKALQNAVALTACDKELARLYNQLKKL